MKAYMVALPSPDGDGYIRLSNMALDRLSGRRDLPAGALQRFRIGVRATGASPDNPFGVGVFRTLEDARNYGLAYARIGAISEALTLCGEAEETRPSPALADMGLELFLAAAFTLREVVSIEGG